MENNEKIYIARRVIRLVNDGDRPGVPFISWFIMFLVLAMIVGSIIRVFS